MHFAILLRAYYAPFQSDSSNETTTRCAFPRYASCLRQKLQEVGATTPRLIIVYAASEMQRLRMYPARASR